MSILVAEKLHDWIAQITPELCAEIEAKAEEERRIKGPAGASLHTNTEGPEVKMVTTHRFMGKTWQEDYIPMTESEFHDAANQVSATLKAMKALIDKASSSLVIVEAARNAIAGVAAHDTLGETSAIKDWVWNHIKYVRDPACTEWLQGPEYTLDRRVGDCDCMATLAGALLGALGHDVHPLGVCWDWNASPSHAVLWDATVSEVVDCVTSQAVGNWPPYGFFVKEMWGVM